MAYAKPSGFSELRFADRESQNIAKTHRTQALIGGAASETAFRESASRYSILHLAAHAELVQRRPMASRVILAPDNMNDGFLNIQEIRELDLAKAWLVVLSACKTQLGEQSRGDEMLAINRAFIIAGAQAITKGILYVISILLYLAGFSIAASSEQRDTTSRPVPFVKTERIEIVDEQGMTRAILGTRPDLGGGLFIPNMDRPLVSIGTNRGGDPMVAAVKKDQDLMSFLYVLNGSPGVTLFNGDGQVILISEAGSTGIMTSRKSTKELASVLTLSGVGAGVELTDRAGMRFIFSTDQVK